MDRLVAMTTAELLDRVDPNLDGIATLRLALASPDHDLDIDVALRAAQTGTQRVRAAGMAALGAHQVDALLDIAPRLVSRGRSGWKQAPADYELQFGAFLALQSLRTERAVQMAVGWLDSPTALAQVALPILAARMPMNDVVAAVNQVEFDDAYLACDILDILIERDTGGAESMVRSLFNAAAYDMLRERCLRYLIAHDHRFVNGDGNVALWDASDLFVRRSAIRMLPLEVSEARLRELAEDEASGVSSDASERLNEWPESRSEE